MDASTKHELHSITSELNSIINELESASHGIKVDFENIGNDRCALAVSNVAAQYKQARGKLRNIE